MLENGMSLTMTNPPSVFILLSSESNTFHSSKSTRTPSVYSSRAETHLSGVSLIPGESTSTPSSAKYSLKALTSLPRVLLVTADSLIQRVAGINMGPADEATHIAPPLLDIDYREPVEEARAMNVLIVGMLSHDSGKTGLALSLVREALSRGLDVGVSKPISGFNGWSQHRYVQLSMERGVLLGEDMYLLHKAAGVREPLEAVGPQVSLLMPPDPERSGWRLSTYRSMIASLRDQVVVARLSRCGEEGVESTAHIYVPENVGRLPQGLEEAAWRLVRSLRPEPRPLNPLELEELLGSEGVIHADTCLDLLASRHGFLVVESYNDAALPTPGCLRSDVVVAVAPGKAAIYSGERYRKAVEVAAGIRKPWQLTTEDVLSLIRPARTMPLRPEPDPRSTAWAEGLLDSVLAVAVKEVQMF